MSVLVVVNSFEQQPTGIITRIVIIHIVVEKIKIEKQYLDKTRAAQQMLQHLPFDRRAKTIASTNIKMVNENFRFLTKSQLFSNYFLNPIHGIIVIIYPLFFFYKK